MIRSHLLDVYGVHLHAVTSRSDWKRLRKSLPAMGKYPDTVAVSLLTTREGKPNVVLFVDVDAHTTPGSLVNTCAHEATHATGQVMGFIQAEHDPTGEPQAYLAGWITQWLWEAVCPSPV